MLKKMCVFYSQSGVDKVVKLLAPDEETAKKVFYSSRLGYAGCGTAILKVEEYDRRQHERLIERGKAAAR